MSKHDRREPEPEPGSSPQIQTPGLVIQATPKTMMSLGWQEPRFGRPLPMFILHLDRGPVMIVLTRQHFENLIDGYPELLKREPQ